ncbi:unnamed protein product [Soboliphyme baturini]|uniref:EF-hand domain-containing protein n=1 Tax=Soboliphyme baturini TaxID=241478 RepID=A0A183IQR8_9BILA|nr:unnamed protein product [Soboliphyme baturini]
MSKKNSRFCVKEVKLTSEQIQEIEKVFAVYGPDADGRIDVSNLKLVLRALGFEPKSDEVIQLTTVLQSEDGKMSLSQLTELLARRMAEKDCRAEIMKAFRLFDTSDCGAIKLEDLIRIGKQLDESVSVEELKVAKFYGDFTVVSNPRLFSTGLGTDNGEVLTNLFQGEFSSGFQCSEGRLQQLARL